MKSKKIKLYAIGNDGNFNYYLLDKKQEVAESISKILKNLFKIFWNFVEEEYKKGKYIPKKVNIGKYKDRHESIRPKENVRVDIFYGDKKMFIAINCSQKNRLKFNEELSKISSMPKPKKIKPFKK